MNTNIFKDSIESMIIKNDKKSFINQRYQKLREFFSIITSVFDEENISVVLVNDESKVIEVFSNDGHNYDYLSNELVDIKLLPEKNNYISPLFNINSESITYRFILFAIDYEQDRVNGLFNRLNVGLNKLFNYDQKEFNYYHNLLNYLDSVDEGISACDGNGIVTYINKAACIMLSGTKEEILNQNLETFIPDSILVKAVKSKKAYLDVDYYIDYKNNSVHLMNSAYPVYGKNQRIIGAVDIYKRIKRSIKVATDLVGYGANYKFEDFIGTSKALSEAIEISKKFANSNKNILIIGDSGTGKELFAQAIHNYSVRREGPFVAINCASYPKDLFESELFGYEEGAFTGAKKGGKTGKFELANGGTIFLDEIGEMPLHLQAKLLRIIETRNLSRIGSNKKVDIDVRIIAATNRNLEEMVQNNSFREDLYYRLKVLYLHLEPLKNREDDVVLLCNHFINKFSKDTFKSVTGLNEEATRFVKEYDWPGNIRELENIISLSLFYCDSEFVTRDDLIRAGLKSSNISNADKICNQPKLSTITKDIIIKALEKNNGNKKKTAEELGISRNTIYRSLQ